MKRIIIVTTLILCISFTLASFMYQVQGFGIGQMGDPESYINQGGSGNNTKAVNIGNFIIGAIRRIGEAISIVMLMVIGIKYIFGSVAEKAEYKQTMMPYVLGAILIFAGSEFTNIIYKMIVG